MRRTSSTHGENGHDLGAEITPHGETQADTSAVRVLVVDDHELLRDSIRRLLHREQDMQWVGEAADADHAVDLVAARQPDVVLMDLSLPGIDGLGATRRIVGSHPSTKVLVLTSFAHHAHVNLALAAGACGVLPKDGNPSTILSGIRSVAMGADPYLT